MDAEQAEAVALLALVAGQDVEPGERPGIWRIARKVAKDRVISTVDPQARHARKTSAQRRDGYKGHIAAEPESGLVTECALTAATAATGPPGSSCWPASSRGLEVLGDSAYGGGATRAALRAAGHSQTIKPIPLQSAVPGGFTIHDFRIDRPGRHGQVPGGLRPRQSPARARPASPAGASSCPLRRRCTTAKRGRTIHLHPHEDELRAARRQAVTRTFQQQLSALAADGGTLAGLAGRRRLPAGALPRDRPQRPVVVAAGRRGQPAPAARDMRVEDAFRPGLFTVDVDDSLEVAAHRMDQAQLGALAVVDGHRLVGIVTERGLVQAIARAADPADVPVAAYASSVPQTASVEQDARAVVQRMLVLGVRHLPVTTSDGQLIGMVSMRDLLAVEAWA